MGLTYGMRIQKYTNLNLSFCPSSHGSISRVACYVTEAASSKTDKKASKVGVGFVSSCLEAYRTYSRHLCIRAMQVLFTRKKSKFY